MVEQERRAAAALAAEHAKVWADRDEMRREYRHQAAGKGRGGAEIPLAETKRDKDGQTVIVKPAKWSLGQIARMAETGFPLQVEAIRNEGSILGEIGDERPEEFVIEDWRPEQTDDET